MAECKVLPSGQRIIYCSDLSGMEIVDREGNVVAAIPRDTLLEIIATYLRREAISDIECAEDTDILFWWRGR